MNANGNIIIRRFTHLLVIASNNQEIQELRDQLAELQLQISTQKTPQGQAPFDKIWIHMYEEDQAISLSQKYLKDVELADNLKGAIKERLKSSLGNAEERITIYKGKDLLPNSTFISELYNTESKALEVMVDRSLDEISEFIKNRHQEVLELLNILYIVAQHPYINVT
ncbi:hypothetical protein C1645_832790 [Glomus cerebriforme]|uniref:Uncharacterized protein n=1 Tax=Glomus cerebriforme TaxID=658196 RepID=A0A397SN87_9GLOM|nr:hypothetical protein C1645_832790 [Glomus cerebriforme]